MTSANPRPEVALPRLTDATQVNVIYLIRRAKWEEAGAALADALLDRGGREILAVLH